MSSVDRTPGPWYASASSPDGLVHGGPDHRVVVPHDRSGFTPSWRWSDARLIAQAPAMLDLLRDLLPMVEDWADGGDDRTATLAAGRIRYLLDRINGK